MIILWQTASMRILPGLSLLSSMSNCQPNSLPPAYGNSLFDVTVNISQTLLVGFGCMSCRILIVTVTLTELARKLLFSAAFICYFRYKWDIKYVIFCHVYHFLSLENSYILYMTHLQLHNYHCYALRWQEGR